MTKIAEYRGLFVTGSLLLILIAATPTIGLFMRIPDGSRKFSELWLLGPTRKAEGYPFNVKIDESYLIYLGVANRLGHPAYYRVYVKLRNQTQPLPTTSNSSPSLMSSIHEFDMFIGDDEVREEPLDLTIFEVSTYYNSTLLKSLQINGSLSTVNMSSRLDVEKNGFFYHLFFELWLYNITSRSFHYHNRFVGIWLNVTRSKG